MSTDEDYKWLRAGDRLADLVSTFVQAGVLTDEQTLACLENWRTERQAFAIECVGEAARATHDVQQEHALERPRFSERVQAWRAWSIDSLPGIEGELLALDDQALRDAMDAEYARIDDARVDAEERVQSHNEWLAFRSWAADHWTGGRDPGDVSDAELRFQIDSQLRTAAFRVDDRMRDAVRAVLLVSEATRGRKDLSTWDYATGGSGADDHIDAVLTLIADPMPALVQLMYGAKEGDDDAG